MMAGSCFPAMHLPEQQQQELEVLEAIYSNEFELIENIEPYSASFRIILTHTHTTASTETSTNDASAAAPTPPPPPPPPAVCIELQCRLPYNYPMHKDSPAKIVVKSIKGLTSEQCQELQEHVNQKCEECATQQEVAGFIVVQLCQEWLDNLLLKQMQKGAIEDEKNAAIAHQIAEDEQKTKLRKSPLGIEPGTIVTPSSFRAWKELFDAERAQKKKERESRHAHREKRLTGRQLFMQNLVKDFGDEDDATAGDESKSVFFFDKDAFVEEFLDDGSLPASEEDEGEA